jgi:ribonuclease E
MANKMLIDASHSEETRVVVTRGNRIDEFDFEAQNRKQLRGNIYLAKVTRVEPSLQAAFVEYGGNRQGFLAFSEIHPDYYQIPVADRLALLEDDARARQEEDDDDDRRAHSRQGRGDSRGDGRHERGGRRDNRSRDGKDGDAGGRGRRRVMTRNTPQEEGVIGENIADDENVLISQDNGQENLQERAQDQNQEQGHVSDAVYPQSHDDALATSSNDAGNTHSDDADHGDDSSDDTDNEANTVEQIGNEDALEEVPSRPRVSRRQYKIQEVIKRRQIILIQVVKEERGNKGAALTTYLSLAGRYSVLMPNTARGGGISRKITNIQDRKNLKEIAQELEVPEGMGVIVRTAGASRTKPEIKRDFEYLMRMWESVRELTLKSSAPCLVYEEGSLIKRSIRDLYNKEIDEVHVAGDEAYKEAKEFMRMLLPSQAKIVKAYKDPQPLFARFGVETQLDAMFQNQVTLKSGGYLVLNQTEALVAIDVNSGRSTREHNIEDTALKTNLEAAEEVARQLRLRDLAGLVVIDFIDMEENRNNRAVEKRLKECLKNDRAKIQVGRISPFGLMEMSRQRLRAGVLESSTVVCEHCAGTGMRRATPSIALHLLRGLEDALMKSATHNVTVQTRTEAALYVLNQKRSSITSLEELFGVIITLQINDTLTGHTHYVIERTSLAAPRLEVPVIQQQVQGLVADAEDEEFEDDTVSSDESDEVEEKAQNASSSRTGGERLRSENGGEEGEPRRRRRRRRGRGGRDREGGERDASASPMRSEASHGSTEGESEFVASSDDESTTNENVNISQQNLQGNGQEGLEGSSRDGRRRRGRRGGRRFGNATEDQNSSDAHVAEPQEGSERQESSKSSTHNEAVLVNADQNVDATDVVEKQPRFRSRATPLAPAVAEALDVAQPVPVKRTRAKAPSAPLAPAAQSIAATPDRVESALLGNVPASKPPVDKSTVFAKNAEPVAVVLSEPVEGPKRSGWWAKAKAAVTGNN